MFDTSPETRLRFLKFKNNRRAFYSLILFTVLFLVSLSADFIANDKPLIVRYDGHWYFPIVKNHPETTFGGTFDTQTDFTDAFIRKKINERGFMLMPPVPFSYDTINYRLQTPAPSAPSRENWLGTDDMGRDILARLLYGLRFSLCFGILLTLFSSVIGLAAGAVQGDFGGKIDLFAQRFLEIWGSLPQLFILILLSGLIMPNFWSLLAILTLFSWTALVPVVRAEFLKVRKADFITAARALGVPDYKIIFRHVLPNATVAALTYLPFILSGAVVSLTALDFLGFGLPPGTPSLGELVRQGKENLQAPWIAATAFLSLAFLLVVLVFVGEGVRDAFDTRKRS